MYICICKAITQKQIEEKMLQTGGNVGLTLKSLGVGSECGTCVEDYVIEIKKKINSQKTDRTRSQSRNNQI